MIKYTVHVPPTKEKGSYKTQANSKADALWDYNSARAHDGLPPVYRMPSGTVYKVNNPKISAWTNGVNLYADDLREFLVENNLPATKENLLNGAKDWKEYSYGGCALIYDADIAERLCNHSELKRKKGGDLQPNSGETWLDVQARALYQAARIVMKGE